MKLHSYKYRDWIHSNWYLDTPMIADCFNEKDAYTAVTRGKDSKNCVLAEDVETNSDQDQAAEDFRPGAKP